MIQVKNLSISFESNSVLEGIAFNVNKGETFAILGRNGSGKSVTLKAIAGLIDNYSGSIAIDGIEIKDFFKNRALYSGKRSREQKKGVAYVFQKGGLFDSMTLFDNAAFGLRRQGYNEDEIHDLVSDAIYRVGLKGNEDKLPSELSGGMQKRAGLARAICMRPDIILYDDPTAGLDPILSDAIADLILEIRSDSDSTSILVTHDLAVAEKLADKTALLYKGKFAFMDTTEKFFSRENSYARQFITGEVEGPIEAM